MATVYAYCVKCRKKVPIQNPRLTTTRNGRTAYVGKCPYCGTKVFRFIGKR